MGLQYINSRNFLIFPPSSRGQWNAWWRSLHSNTAGACWNFIKQTVLWLCSVLSNLNLMWIPLGIREGQSLCTSTTRNRGWATGTHHSSCQLGHVGYAAECLVRAKLSHRCLPSNKRGAHWVCVCVCDATWNCMRLCNCSHQFCKNIPVSFYFITTWNKGVFFVHSVYLHWLHAYKILRASWKHRRVKITLKIFWTYDISL